MNCLKGTFLFGLLCALAVVPFTVGTATANEKASSSVQTDELAWGGHRGGWGGRGYGGWGGRGYGGGYGGYRGYSSYGYSSPYYYSSYYPYNYYSPYYYSYYGY